MTYFKVNVEVLSKKVQSNIQSKSNVLIVIVMQ